MTKAIEQKEQIQRKKLKN